MVKVVKKVNDDKYFDTEGVLSRVNGIRGAKHLSHHIYPTY
jgi:hypothetical protein